MTLAWFHLFPELGAQHGSDCEENPRPDDLKRSQAFFYCFDSCGSLTRVNLAGALQVVVRKGRLGPSYHDTSLKRSLLSTLSLLHSTAWQKKAGRDNIIVYLAISPIFSGATSIWVQEASPRIRVIAFPVLSDYNHIQGYFGHSAREVGARRASQASLRRTKRTSK